MATPYATVAVDTVASTQDTARRAFLEKEGDPLLVVAERQEGGRGRSGSSWWQAPRAMFSSLAMTEPWPASALPVVPLVIGLALRDAIADVLGVAVGLKWPNDLMTGEGKVGGVLVERAEPVVTIGCGANLWWPDPPAGAAGLVPDDPGAGVAAELAAAWVERWLVAAGAEGWDRAAYLAACVTVGTNVGWDQGRTGRAVDVDHDGGLVVVTAEGSETLRSGEVRLLRPATLSPRQYDRSGDSDTP